jgi:sugar lactone lactonase YvrE
MLHTHRCSRIAAVVMTFGLFAGAASAQSGAPAQPLPDPYKADESWAAKMPEGRTWGSPGGLATDRKGNLWVFERCGANTCAGSSAAAVLEFDPSGKLMKSFGAGMFVFPHAIFVDHENNIWVTDADGKDGKGHTVVKFSPEGKVLMTLGKAGVTGDGPDTFNRPSGVVVAPNGDIFVADGHGGTSNARIVKFSKDGKFVKTWGIKGTDPGQFGALHSIAMDSKERIFVADRGNNRIQVFDKDGNFIAQWTQFGRPSGLFIDSKDMIYVADNTAVTGGIRIGSAKDGSVTAFVPDADSDPKHGAAEDVSVDPSGNLYAAETLRQSVTKCVKQ